MVQKLDGCACISSFSFFFLSWSTKNLHLDQDKEKKERACGSQHSHEWRFMSSYAGNSRRQGTYITFLFFISLANKNPSTFLWPVSDERFAQEKSNRPLDPESREAINRWLRFRTRPAFLFSWSIYHTKTEDRPLRKKKRNECNGSARSGCESIRSFGRSRSTHS